MLKTLNFIVAGLTRSFYAIFVYWDTTLEKEFRIIISSTLPCEVRNPTLLRAVLLVEDRRFFNHKGIDVRAIMRALYRTLLCGRLEGGSTIEQQYVRMVTNRKEITLKRKMREWMLATKLSDTCSKLQILNSYLLTCKFIGHARGMDELARKNCFNIENLNNDQISILVARLKYPFTQQNSPILLRRLMIIRHLIEQQKFPANNSCLIINHSLIRAN